MGVWGVALYSGDFAADLRGTIGAVSRLPFDAERIADIVCDTEPAASDPQDSDHTTFWLVLADQFAKRGLRSDRVQRAVLSIIDEGRDLEALRALGMTATDLAKRRRVLEDLRNRILEPQSATSKRPTMKNPQPFLMDVGDILVYPTEDGKPFNPYFSPRLIESIRQKHGRVVNWKPNGWSACVVIARGRAFDYLAWYQPLTLFQAVEETPLLEMLKAGPPWRLRSPGTCSKPHFERMQLRKLSQVSVDLDAVTHRLGPLPSGVRSAISDISIANQLGVASAKTPFQSHGTKIASIQSLDEIVTG